MASLCQDEVVDLIDRRRPWDMVSTIGPNLAKYVLQIHGIDPRARSSCVGLDDAYMAGLLKGQFVSCVCLGMFGTSLAGLLLLEQLLAPGAFQRITLQVEVLVESGDAGISNEHVGLVDQARLSGNRNPVIFSRQK